MQRLDDLELRSRMALGGTEGRAGVLQHQTALAHSISYEMTLRYGLPHGIACSFTLPMVLERAIGTRADRDAVLARGVHWAARRRAAAPARLPRRRWASRPRFAELRRERRAKAQRMVAHALDGARGKNFIGTTVKETA